MADIEHCPNLSSFMQTMLFNFVPSCINLLTGLGNADCDKHAFLTAPKFIARHNITHFSVRSLQALSPAPQLEPGPEVVDVLNNLQHDIGDWLPLINKPDTIATYSIPTATCRQQLTTPNNACPCVHACRPEVPQYRTEKKLCYYNGSNSMIDRERERE